MNTPTPKDSNTVAINSPAAQAPLFLTGFARSGTTWVNKLLRDYFDAGFVNEGQFIVSFGRRLTRYGDLREAKNHSCLLRDLRADPFFVILKRNYSVEIDWSQVATASRNFGAIVLEVLRQIAEQMGKSRIGSKYPLFGMHLNLLDQHFPNCRVVHVIRDGRDCALSHRALRWGHQNTYAAAVHWRDYLHQARRDAQHMQGGYLEVRYEDLLAEPGPSMAALEQFLTGTSGPITERFLADSGRLKPEKVGGWRHAMPAHAQAIFEGVAGDALREAGYPLTGVGHRPVVFLRALYGAHDRLTREGWHWARKFFPAIPERKG